MSCDFLVFETEAAPRDRKAFMAWFNQITDWDMEAEFDDPAIASQRLQNWYAAMAAVYRPLNGPQAVPDAEEDDPKVTDYTITPTAIYAGFRWSEANGAMEACKRLAFENGLGFFDPQSDDHGIYFPDIPGNGRLQSSGPWWRRLLFG